MFNYLCSARLISSQAILRRWSTSNFLYVTYLIKVYFLFLRDAPVFLVSGCSVVEEWFSCVYLLATQAHSTQSGCGGALDVVNELIVPYIYY